MKKLAIIIAAVAISAPASYANSVQILDLPYWSSIVPDTQILIRNASGFPLSVWIFHPIDRWRKYEVRAENSVIIESRQSTIGIATTESSSEDNIQPNREPSTIDEAGVTDGVFFFRQLRGGTRSIFCWSPSRNRWLIQTFGERICD